MIRIAICLSGQARAWRIAVPAIRAFFDNAYSNAGGVTTDYFIHTWDHNDWKARTGDRAPEHEELSDDEFKDMIEAYRPKAMQVDHWQDTGRAWSGLLDSFAKANHLKRVYEIEQGIEYDFVVKTRLDLIFHPGNRFNAHMMLPLNVYASHFIAKFPTEYFRNELSDLIFYSDSPTMDLLADCGRVYRREHSKARYEADVALNNPSSWFRYGPGTLLYQHAVALGIHPQAASPIIYTVVRREAMERRLDAVADFDEIRRLHLGFYT